MIGARVKLAWLTAVAAACLAHAQSNVKDCRPCTFSPDAGHPPYSFTFEWRQANQERAIAAIEVVNTKTKASQRLAVSDMDPVASDQEVFFGGVDVNFDGFLDLMLITSRGIANAYADYWLFDPVKGTFELLGNFPVFVRDPKRKRLKSYEREGSAGLEYEAKEFAFDGRKLVVMREEKQEPAAGQEGVFRKEIKQRVNGAMKVVKTESVRAPQ